MDQRVVSAVWVAMGLLTVAAVRSLVRGRARAQKPGVVGWLAIGIPFWVAFFFVLSRLTPS
jgi:hypothetical protein